MWVDKAGKNYTTEQVRDLLERSTGSRTAADYIRVGGVYINGSIWLQRIS